MSQIDSPLRNARTASTLAALAVTGCLAVATVTVALQPEAASDAAAPAAASPARSSPAADGPMAQSYSPYCQTSQGSCTLPTALPIGSPCDCNGVPGQVVP